MDKRWIEDKDYEREEALGSWRVIKVESGVFFFSFLNFFLKLNPGPHAC